MTDAIVVLNAGSSSVKFAAYRLDGGGAEPAMVCGGQVEGIGSDAAFQAADAQGRTLDVHDWPRGRGPDHKAAIAHVVDWIEARFAGLRVAAAGHRVVFGGYDATRPTRLDAAAIARIEALVPFFPLHLPHNLAAIRAMAEAYPAVTQIACFDNAFHATWPRLARLFALPRALTEAGVLRYGFHGLSYEYIARRLPDVVPGASSVVVAHLGSGASLCAIRDGVSVEGTLGFSGLDGLPMGTRTGAIDPGVLLYLMQAKGMGADALERLLYKQSGLLGVSGISNDMRDLAASDDPRAEEAIALFCYQIARHLGALAATLEGLDALVFTAGIGEHATDVRARVCRQASWLGLTLDEAANAAGGPRISTEGSRVSAWVIPTDEEKMIAIHTAAALSGGDA
jgi:acetate kinase